MSVSAAAIAENLLDESRNQMRACRQKIRHCLDQLTDLQVWHRSGDGFNSIANLVLHLEGNLRQRILSLIGGAPDVRNRPREFAERGPIAKSELITRFEDAMTRSEALLADLPAERLLEARRYQLLRGPVEGTVLTLIVHTLVHLGGHTQEIVALTRLQLGEGYRFLQTPVQV